MFDRSKGVGGSDVPAILGVSPWDSITDVWLEKTHHPSWRPKDVSPEMRFGTLLEPVIRAAYEEDTGRRVHAPGDKTYWAEDHIRYAHLDGLVAGEGIWEGKAPFQTWRKWGLGPPVYVHAQVQHYMDITGEPWCDVSALAAGLNPIFQTFRIPADPPAQRAIRVAIDRFWEEHVLTKEPPEPLRAIVEYPTHKSDLLVVADTEAEHIVTALQLAKTAGHLEASREEELKEALKQKIGSAAGMTGEGWRIRYKKSKDSEITDWKLVAGVWRKQLEQIEIIIQDGGNHMSEAEVIGEALRVLTDEPLPDTVISLYTTVKPGTRPFVLEFFEEVT